MKRECPIPEEPSPGQEITRKTCGFSHQHSCQARDSGGQTYEHISDKPTQEWKNSGIKILYISHDYKLCQTTHTHTLSLSHTHTHTHDKGVWSTHLTML